MIYTLSVSTHWSKWLVFEKKLGVDPGYHISSSPDLCCVWSASGPRLVSEMSPINRPRKQEHCTWSQVYSVSAGQTTIYLPIEVSSDIPRYTGCGDGGRVYPPYILHVYHIDRKLLEAGQIFLSSYLHYDDTAGYLGIQYSIDWCDDFNQQVNRVHFTIGIKA